MPRPIYRIDEIAKTILIGLEISGKKKTFAQLLEDAKVEFDKDIEIEVANTLEALRLIEAVTYQLPLEIRAELSATGKAIVASLKKSKQGAVPDHKMNRGGRSKPGLPTLL
jgi:hypothetical protein